MRKPVTLAATAAALVVATVALAACGTQPSTPGAQTLPSLPTSPIADHATPTPTASSHPSAPATPTAATNPTARPSAPPVHFDSPEAAMRYLAAAYDRGDRDALRAVTTPASREALWEMRSEAVNLRLTSCDRSSDGSYVCQFTHDYPASLHLTGHGASTMLVSPATRPGWYLSELMDCG
jgi:hypothetical protein